jgi:SAM-dependent methyltransferase
VLRRSKRPYPGDDLAATVTGHRDRDQFFESGRQSVEELRRIVAGARLHGCDVDAEAIAWLQSHLTYADAVVNSPLPPLPYPDDSFDLIFNHSVFSHIDEQRQDAMLAELARVAQPGAHIVLTVHGEPAFQIHEQLRRGGGQDPAPERAQLEREGILFLPSRQAGFPDWYATTYHTTGYVFEHWSRRFTVEAYVCAGALGFQDTVLLSNGRPTSWLA